MREESQKQNVETKSDRMNSVEVIPQHKNKCVHSIIILKYLKPNDF